MKRSWIKKIQNWLRSKDGSMVTLFALTLIIHQWIGPSSDSNAAPNSKILTTKKNSNVLNSKKKTTASTPTPTNTPTPPPGSCSDCSCHLSPGPGGVCEAIEFGFQCRVFTDNDGFGCGRDTMQVVGCCAPTDTPTPTPTHTPTNTPTPACPNWNGSAWNLGNAQYFHNAPATCAHPTVNVCFSNNPCLTPEITWPISGSLPTCNSAADNGNTSMVSPRCPQYEGPDWNSLSAAQKTDCCTGGGSATLTWNEPNYDYGNREVGSGQNHWFTITNSGTAASGICTTVTIGGADPTQFNGPIGGTCMSAGAAASGGTCTVRMSASPTSTGVKRATFTLVCPNGSGSTNANGVQMTAISPTPTPTPVAFDCTTLNGKPFSAQYVAGDQAIGNAPEGATTRFDNSKLYWEPEHTQCLCSLNGGAEQYYCTDQGPVYECGYKNWVMEGMGASSPRIISGGPVPPNAIVYDVASPAFECGGTNLNAKCIYRTGTYGSCGGQLPDGAKCADTNCFSRSVAPFGFQALCSHCQNAPLNRCGGGTNIGTCGQITNCSPPPACE